MAAWPRLRGLYAILNTGIVPPGELLARATAAIEGGAMVLQYRDKTRDPAGRRQDAAALQTVCERAGVPLIINDDVELAYETGAAGVHLGKDDARIGSARQRLGDNTLIGASCYNDMNLALAAASAGADYVAFGRMYQSTTKPGDIYAGTALIAAAKQRVDCAIVAIGGITPDNAATLIAAGADSVAVIGALFAHPDTRAQAERFRVLFDRSESSR